MSDILLGIDVGTSSCKVAAFDKAGNVVAQSFGEYEVFHPQVGWAEQNPVDWWNAIVTCLKDITSKVDAARIKGIGIDGQSWSAIAIDKDKNVLCNTPIWFDTRAKDICERVKAQYGNNAFFETSGNPFEPSYTLPKIIWYKENAPQVYNNTYKILQSNSYIVMMLTGEISQEYSQGYGLQCYDIKKRCWDFSILEKLGLRCDILPDFYECHQVVAGVTDEVAKATGLCAGTPVVAGGLDAACGTLGVGVIHNGQTQEQGGQAGGMSICEDTPIAHEALILSEHVVAGKWLLQGGTVGGGGVVNWFERTFYEHMRNKETGKPDFKGMDELAAEIDPCSDGLLFLPYMSGERSPIWDPDATGIYFGVDFSKTKAHFIRASMEGVGFSLEHNLQVAEQSGAKVDTLFSMGGAANSRLWTQMKADITGKEIAIPNSDNASTLGAVILAGVGVGMYKDFDDAVQQTISIKRTHSPNSELYQTYQKAMKKYLALYESTKQLMKD